MGNTSINRSIDLSFGLIVVILNIAEIVLLTNLKRKKKIYEIFLLSLSIADLLFGLSNAIVCILFLSNQQHEEVIEITYTTYFFFVLTSILHLSLISLDRVWAIYKPIKHKINITTRKVYVALAITWIVALIISIALIVYDETAEGFITKQTTTRERIIYENVSSIINQNYKNISGNVIGSMQRPPRFNITQETVVIFIDNYPAIMKTTLSCIIIIADVFFIATNGFVVYTMQQKKTVKVSTKVEDKASAICILITIVFILFTLPYALMKFISGTVPLWANLMLVTNSAINSIVYFFRGKLERYIDKQKGKEQYISSGTGTTPITMRARNVKNYTEESDSKNE